MSQIKAFSAQSNASGLSLESIEVPDIKKDEIKIDVKYCGLCHSDLSMLNNDWGLTQYPFVPGHEIVGLVSEVGEDVTLHKVGDTVGLGWFSRSCLECSSCDEGDLNLCLNGAEATIIGRSGGFAEQVVCQAKWASPIGENINSSKAGPLFCGGITVFNPIVQNNIKPTDRVGVVGIGGLGHLALQFLNKWGCEVTAFTSSSSKVEEAKNLGAHNIVNSKSSEELEKIAGTLDFILVTVNVDLDWDSFISVLAPKGKIHFVGAVPNPVPIAIFPMLAGQKSLSASPLGSPSTINKMLDFCERHGIEPMTEFFPMSKVNDAIKHLEEGKARYRIVLENDF